ncbi:hypothetical protein [Desulfolithobacter sp.]
MTGIKEQRTLYGDGSQQPSSKAPGSSTLSGAATGQGGSSSRSPVSTRKILYSALCGITVLLSVVIIMALLQYRLTAQYNEIIDQGEKVVFRFSSLREYLTRAILERKWSQLEGFENKIEALNSDFSRLLDHQLIPTQYKLALIDKVGIGEIALLARQMANEEDKITPALKLHDRLRSMSDQLMQFDRVLIGQMKSNLVRFQNLIIGTLALITGAISLLLVFLYRKALLPLLDLSRQVHESDRDQELVLTPGACQELKDLTERLNFLLFRSGPDHPGEGNVYSPHEMNVLNNQLNAIINYTQLLLDNNSQRENNPEEVRILRSIMMSGEQIGLILQEKQR